MVFQCINIKAAVNIKATVFNTSQPASVAQLDARPTGDQEVTVSNPAEDGNILSWR